MRYFVNKKNKSEVKNQVRAPTLNRISICLGLMNGRISFNVHKSLGWGRFTLKSHIRAQKWSPWVSWLVGNTGTWPQITGTTNCVVSVTLWIILSLFTVLYYKLMPFQSFSHFQESQFGVPTDHFSHVSYNESSYVLFWSCS